jgi:serine/threonine protein kinase
MRVAFDMVDSLAPVRPDKFAVGDVIGAKYRLERLLGEGGQAWVWQARNLALDSCVALKVLRDDGSNAPQIRRLLQEARAAARLGHPAIVRVFDLGEAESGEPFLVMELLDGESLADRLVERGRMSPFEAIRVLLPIADALGAAHAKGIVHRDLKPDNVFLAVGNDSLQPKLLDFGIVKLQHSAAEGDRLSTVTGAVVGSPAYLSPEQARGSDDIDRRVDVWGLSVTLYECLTGDVPFEGANYNALLRSIVEDEPLSILEHRVNEPELWQIVQRGLSKSRDERWPSTLELGQALAAWASQRGVTDDVCRTPLESKWLRSGTIPARARLPSAESLDQSKEHAPLSREERPQSVSYARRALLPTLAVLATILAGASFWSRSRTPSTPAPERVNLAPSRKATTLAPSVSPPSVPQVTLAPSKSAPDMVSSGPRVAASTGKPTLPAAREQTPRKAPTPRAEASGDLYLISPY